MNLFNDPLFQNLAIGALLVLIVWYLLRWARGNAGDARYARRRRAEVQQARRDRERQHADQIRAAAQVLATSSTARLAGYRVVRQIETLVTDGHASPAEAILALKALAAGRGANGIIHLVSERLPGGKCLARGDAVVLTPEGEPPAAPPGPAGEPRGGPLAGPPGATGGPPSGPTGSAAGPPAP